MPWIEHFDRDGWVVQTAEATPEVITRTLFCDFPTEIDRRFRRLCDEFRQTAFRPTHGHAMYSTDIAKAKPLLAVGGTDNGKVGYELHVERIRALAVTVRRQRLLVMFCRD